MLICRSPKTVVAFMRHGRSAVNHMDEEIKVGKHKFYPPRFDAVDSSLWPVVEDELELAPEVFKTFLASLPEGVQLDHFGVGYFLRHMQTALAALTPVYPDAQLGIHSGLKERPFGELDYIEPHRRANVDPHFVLMEEHSWWLAKPAHGLSHDELSLSIHDFWLNEASMTSRCGLYFTSNGPCLCLRYLAECLDPRDLARPRLAPWERVPNLGILCYSNFPFNGKGPTMPYLSYGMAVYPERGKVVVTPQGLMLPKPKESNYQFNYDYTVPWPKLYSLDELKQNVEELYPRSMFDRSTGLVLR